jgi:hypothetical protein
VRYGGLAALVLGLFVLTPPLAGAADRTGLSLSLGGGLAAGGLDWTVHSSFPLYAEEARLGSSYDAGSGPALEGAVDFCFSRHLGVVAAIGWSRREATATVEASLPHPLYLDRPRSVDGRVAGLDYRQLAAHFDLELRTTGRRLEATFFAGLTLLRVETTLVETVEANEEYPYDEASFRRAVTASTRSDLTFGWNAGGGLGLPIGGRVVIGVRARYARAGVDVTPSAGDGFRVDAGGLQAIAFLRLRF